MPGSYPAYKKGVAQHIRSVIGDDMRVVDIGPGAGIWADLIGLKRMDAIEVWSPYVERFGLREKYINVIEVDARTEGIFPGPWQYVILGDVLEHMTVEEARWIISTITDAGRFCLVALPYRCPQDVCEDNPYEVHVQDDLTPENVAERYPELHLLVGDAKYGYYVNYPAEPLVPNLDEGPLGPPHPVDVLWLNGQRGYWDHGLLMAAFDGDLYATPRRYNYKQHEVNAEVGKRGSILIDAGRGQGDHAAQLSTFVSERAWTLAIHCSDEECAGPFQAAYHQNSMVWLQTPSPLRGHDLDRLRRTFIFGWPSDTRRLAKEIGLDAHPPARERLWALAGQVNHIKREECVAVLKTCPDGFLHTTSGFADTVNGIARPDYIRLIVSSSIIPSPSGPQTPDAFRTWEALELGCLPIADAHSPTRTYPEDYYSYALRCLPHQIPFPRLNHWSELRPILDFYRANPLKLLSDRNNAFSWWQRYKRQFVVNLETDLHAVSGIHVPPSETLRDRLTILMPTSPIPAHPSTEMIEEAIGRIRAYPDLADAEILIMIDGVRPEQEHRRADYEAYVEKLLWLCNWDARFKGVLPIVFPEHTHQAAMARAALDLVQTAYVFYVEHDTWPVGEIDFRGILRAMEVRDDVKMVRLHYDVAIHPEHRQLLRAQDPVDVAGVSLIPTIQWSQRPHLAPTTWYRWVIKEFFPETARTMIEDRMHGVVQDEVARHRIPWQKFGLWIYHPGESIKRSATCDGRQGDIKYQMSW